MCHGVGMLVNTPVIHRVNWESGMCKSVSALMSHPSLERWCLKKSLAASLIAFSGATPMSCGRRPAKYYS